MIVLKSHDEIETMRVANGIVVEVMDLMAEQIVPGVRTIDLNAMADEHIRRRGAIPSFVGYHGYQHALCTSINEEVVHGIPGDRTLQEGDIISIDCGVYWDGFHGDHARAFYVGENPPATISRLLKVSEEALGHGIAQMRTDKRLFDISAAVQHHVEAHGYSVVRDYVGHGIGRQLHEEPQVPNFGRAGTGMKLLPGLVLAIEPMVNAGKADVRLLDDGWTVVTQDRSLSVHVEHSVALLENGPRILSKG
ncbi:MAG: type I methionyl aminopeptidase [Deltaproteobacteria bacterium]|nr:type I methionyl aminopeptidase [Deltaproteobacteria bacterium]